MQWSRPPPLPPPRAERQCWREEQQTENTFGDDRRGNRELRRLTCAVVRDANRGTVVRVIRDRDIEDEMIAVREVGRRQREWSRRNEGRPARAADRDGGRAEGRGVRAERVQREDEVRAASRDGRRGRLHDRKSGLRLQGVVYPDRDDCAGRVLEVRELEHVRRWRPGGVDL